MFKNTSLMIALHGTNLLVPLLFTPLLVRGLGLQGFGKFSLCLAITQITMVVAEYGFSLGAAKDAAHNRDNRSAISELFTNVQFTKLILLAILFLVLIVLIGTVRQMNELSDLLIISFIGMAFQTMTPLWLLNGLDLTVLSTFVTTLFRLLTVPTAILFVKDTNDIKIAILIYHSPYFFVLLLSHLYLFRNLNIKTTRCDCKTLKELITKYFPLFASGLAASIYTSATAAILGFTSGSEQVGIYAAADKIRQAAQSLITPITQVFYPKINYELNKDYSRGFRTIKKAFFMILLSNFFSLIVLLGFTKPIVQAAFGNVNIQIVQVLLILAPVIVIIGFNVVLGTLIMVPLNKVRAYSKLMAACAVFHVPSVIFLSKFYHAKGAALAILLTESLIMMLMIATISRKKLSAGKQPAEQISLLRLILNS